MHDSSRFPLLRKQTIRDRLVGGTAVQSNDLAAEFGVSEDAIRRDLRALADEGICQRVYGGALPLSPASGPITARMRDDPSEKNQLARRVLGLLKQGETVFLDSSSTNLLLARLIPPDIRVHIITNSVLIAAELTAKPDLEVNILGGRVNAHVGGRVDGEAMAALSEFSIDLCFLGACAFDQAEGLAGFERDDVAFKRQLIRASRSTAVLLTAEKLGTFAPYRICRADEIGTYVLPGSASRPLGDNLQESGRMVLFAETLPLKD